MNHRSSILYLLFTLCLAGAGCRTAEPLPPINLSEPGWKTVQGQAIWKPPIDRSEIAGDLVVATNPNGDCFIQFTKNPFTLAMAEVQGGRWEIRFGGDQHSWHGKGRPPARFSWFQLPDAIAGRPLNDGWKFSRLSGNLWRLENPHTGETLAGEFFP